MAHILCKYGVIYAVFYEVTSPESEWLVLLAVLDLLFTNVVFLGVGATIGCGK